MAAKRIDLGDKIILYQYQNGMSISKIADLNYVSKKTIYRRLEQLGVVSKHRILNKISKQDLQYNYQELNMSISSLSQKYKTSKYYIRQALSKYNIQIRGGNKNESTTRINN